MNKIKKLGIVLVALAMCVMLGVTGWAANSVSYSVVPEQATVCVSEDMQRVTVTLKASEEIAITSMYLEVIIPDGWSINTVMGSETVLIDENNYNTDTGKDLIVWYESEAGNKTTTDLLTIIYDVPSGVTGSFNLGVTDLELATMKDGYNLEVLTEKTEVTEMVTIKDHEYTATGYTWNADNTECTASGKCACGKTATAKSTGVTSEQTKDPTCEDKGETTYTATFTEAWAETQTETEANVAALDHAWGEPSNYTDNGDGTHTANYVCGNDKNHTKSDAPVEHTYNQEGDKCVCGAEKPAADDEIIYGDADGDGDITIKDAALIQQYLGDYDVTIKDSADADGDGDITIKDAALIQQYLGDYDVTLGPKD